MILTSVALSLLALVAGMYLLDKTKKEGLGNFFNFISWLVIVVALLILFCALTRGVWRMSCSHYKGSSMEMCRPGMMGDDYCMPMRGHKGMMRDECCDEMMGGDKMRGHCGDMEEEEDENNAMEKEIRIEKDTVIK